VLIRYKDDEDVTIAPVGREPIFVEAGASVEVDDDLGMSLLEQSDKWAPAGPTNVEMSIPGVLAQVGDSKDRARTALEKEQATDKPRATLIAALTKIIESEED